MRSKPHGALAYAVIDYRIQTVERPTTDEQDILSIDLYQRLFGMLAPPFGRNSGNRALENLQQFLLHPFAGNVPGDGRIPRFSGDFVYFVDKENAALRLADIVVGGLQDPHQDILYILAHVPSLGENSGIDDGKRNLEDASQRLGQQGFAGARGPDEENIALPQLYIASPGIDPFVVVVHGDGKGFFGPFLADDMFVQMRFYFGGFGKRSSIQVGLLSVFFFQHLIAQPNALVAYVDRGPLNDLLDLIDPFSAERTGYRTARFFEHTPGLSFRPSNRWFGILGQWIRERYILSGFGFVHRRFRFSLRGNIRHFCRFFPLCFFSLLAFLPGLHHIDCLKPLGSASHHELHLISLSETPIPRGDVAPVDKDIYMAIRRDKAISFIIIEPLHDPFYPGIFGQALTSRSTRGGGLTGGSNRLAVLSFKDAAVDQFPGLSPPIDTLKQPLEPGYQPDDIRRIITVQSACLDDLCRQRRNRLVVEK